MLWADVCKYQPEVCNSKKLKILKKKKLQQLNYCKKRMFYFDPIIITSKFFVL